MIEEDYVDPVHATIERVLSRLDLQYHLITSLTKTHPGTAWTHVRYLRSGGGESIQDPTSSQQYDTSDDSLKPHV
jgi:hypothetical protein